MLEIDGSFGEGGGQTLRIATAFSVIFNRAIHVTNVRAGRKMPGLRPQHSVTLGILRAVCGGTLSGGHVGSTEFTFVPGKIQSGSSMSLDMGTAGSVTLVTQAVVPAVSLSGASFELDLTGGTDVPWSPTSDYASTVLATCMRRLGISFSLDVTRRGYYPRGGGRAKVRISPCEEVGALDLSSRGNGPPPEISIVSRAGDLPRHVAERQLSSAISTLRRNGLSAKNTSVYSEDSVSPGSSILISALTDSCYLGADAIGARGKPAEKVGEESAESFAGAYRSGACVDSNLVDMIAPLLLLAKAPSSLLAPEVTGHLTTSLHVARQFVEGEWHSEPRGTAALITVNPGGAAK